MRLAVIDGGLRHTADAVPHGQFWKLGRFHHLSLDHRAFHRHLVSEHHGPRTVGSGRGNKDLQEDRFVQTFEKRPGLRIQARVPVRDEDDVLNERSKFMSGRDP